ncbi:MAG: preprotein translocase subunit SecA [bacterium]|nr:preprotein translocase subunit SecA [bacterium]
MFNFLTKMFGSQSERELKKILPQVEKINSFGQELIKLSEPELKAKTNEFRGRLNNGETLDDLLPEAFAVVREASRRRREWDPTWNMVHFDVQLIGGIVLHQGRIAEMATGEGKTLVATLPAYLNALTGKGVHVITVNDYLAKRDRLWMGPLFEYLGLTVGVIQSGINHEDRRNAYMCDITYGTNNEFGFDYLRDNMALSKEEQVQRGHYFVIVDEVDSILIDEARTPLIISGPAEESTDKYYRIDSIIPLLSKDKDYIVEEKEKRVLLTEEGVLRAEKLLQVENLYTGNNIEWVHHINQALRAHTLFKKDVDYIIKDGQILIIDEFTGRLMTGRRWSDGLHQAIEAKEHVKIENENQTLATITIQNYFRMYEKLSGMTGTAVTEEVEFHKIYNLDVVVIPTNRPLSRANFSDVIYRTEKEKFNAVVDEIGLWHGKGRPLLVGTISIEKSELLSMMLKRKGIKHNVLNAKYHEKEAQIISQAGRLGAVTIATNMAGRGTDILLGGNSEVLAKELIGDDIESPEEFEKQYKTALEKVKMSVGEEHKKVVELGGLYVLGTERHESRRIDNQLRGRCGRQGDPGVSRFYISLEDDLMRLFGSDKISGMMSKLGMQEGEDIQHPWVTKAIETAQKRVESHNFDIRKHLLEYDDVMNKQRVVIYEERQAVLKGEELKEHIQEMLQDVLQDKMDIFFPENVHTEEWNSKSFIEWFHTLSPIGPDIDFSKVKREEIEENIYSKLTTIYEDKEKEITSEIMRKLERMIILQVVDNRWKDHLLTMDHLREGINLRAYAQKDPLVEYQHEGFIMFNDMNEKIKEEVIDYIYRIQLKKDAVPVQRKHQPMYFSHAEPGTVKKAEPRHAEETGRNDPCPCGSGKKYKKCCGAMKA